MATGMPAGFDTLYTALFQLSKLASGGAPVTELARALAASARELADADTGAVQLLDEGGTELLCQAAAGLSAQEEGEYRFAVGQGVAGWVVQQGLAARIDDVYADSRFERRESQKTPIRSMLCVPLLARSGAIGVLSVTSEKVAAFGAEHEESLTYLAGSILKDLEGARSFRLAVTDTLTTAYNRQHLWDVMPQQIAKSRRAGEPFSLLAIDLDGLGKINDTAGREAGDHVVRVVGRALLRRIREVDVLVRFGGEAFLALLPRTDLAGAAKIAERLRANVEQLDVEHAGQRLVATISIGAVQLNDLETQQELIRRAESQLAAAKSAGRNRVAAG